MRDGLKIVLNISKLGNQYIQANKPWVLIKGNDDERYRHQLLFNHDLHVYIIPPLVDVFLHGV